MRFSFSVFNHCPVGQIAVADIVQIMSHQMRAVGHEVVEPNKIFLPRADGYNVVLENFVEPDYTEIVARAWADGCRFIYIATEEPSPLGFNAGLDPGMVKRQERFPEAAKYCDGILHLIPGDHVRDWYSQFAPTAYAELGYAASLVRDRADDNPECDFGFFGQETWRRRLAFDRLAEISGKPIVAVLGLSASCEERDDQMRNAKVIVQIRANLEVGFVSSTRCAVALSIGRPVIAEPHAIPGPWADVVDFSGGPEAFYADALAATRRWRDLHREQFARFKERLSPEVCIGEPLRQIGIG